jgi:hypothetical protein
MKENSKYFLAILSCLVIFIIYVVIINGVLGSKNGGGVLPILILLYLLRSTWKAIIGKKKSNADRKHNPKKVERIKEEVSNPLPVDTSDSVLPFSISPTNIDSENNISGEDWICDKCNEKIDGNFDTCWNCTAN